MTRTVSLPPSPRRSARFTSLRWLLVPFVALVLSSCKTAVNVDLTSDAKGAGTLAVRLEMDKEAAAVFRNREEPLVVQDLIANGWAVGDLEATDSGGLRIRADRSFSTAAEATALLQQLTGQDGPLGSLSLRRQRKLLATEIVLDGTVDLSKGLGAFGDSGLASLGGSTSNLGVDDAEVERQAGTPLPEAFTFAFAADIDGKSESWPVALGSTARLALTAKRTAVDALAFLLAGLSGIAGLVLLVARRDHDR